MKVDWWGLHIVIGELRCCWVSLQSKRDSGGRGKRGMKESEPQNESSTIFEKIFYSLELLMPLIKANISKRMHVNYSEIIHSVPIVCSK